MNKLMILLLAALLLSACSGDKKTTIKAQPELAEKQHNPAKKSNFADGQIQVYKNSQDVENTLNAAEERRRAEMEKQGI